jgi:hypothetical protein
MPGEAMNRKTYYHGSHYAADIVRKGRWRKALAIGLAGLGMAAAPMTGKAAGSEEQWDASLNQLWHQLSQRQQQELRTDEREWIRWKDKLLGDDERIRAIQDRIDYLTALTKTPEELESDQIAATPRSQLSPANQKIFDVGYEYGRQSTAKMNNRAQAQDNDARDAGVLDRQGSAVFTSGWNKGYTETHDLATGERLTPKEQAEIMRANQEK